MVKLLGAYLFLVLTIIFTGSALRESRFCDKLKENYNLEFIQKLQVNQIHRRINAITRAKIQYNLTADGVTFANASIRSFRLLHDLLDNSTSPLSPSLNISSHYYSALYEKYEGLVRKFHQSFIAENPQIISIDYEDPESLWVKLNSLDNSGNSTDTFQSIRKKALLLVDAYKEDIDYIQDHYASTVSTVLTPRTISKEKCNHYGSCNYKDEVVMRLAPIPTENQVKLAKFCSNSLATLRDEIEVIQKTGPLSIPAFDILLQRFISITELITTKADTVR